MAGELSAPGPSQRDQQPAGAPGMPPHEPTALAAAPSPQAISLKPLKAGAPAPGALAGGAGGMAAAGSDAQAADARQAAAAGAVAAGAPGTSAPAPQPLVAGSTPAAGTTAGTTAMAQQQKQQQQQAGGVATPAAAPQAATPAASPPTAQRQAGAAGPAAAAAAAEAAAAALMPPPPPSPVQQALTDLDALLQRLAALDPDGWFRHPVRESDAPNYYKIIRRPMCFEVGAVRGAGVAGGHLSAAAGHAHADPALCCRKCQRTPHFAVMSALALLLLHAVHHKSTALAESCQGRCQPTTAPPLTPAAAVHARQGARAAVRHVAGAGARL